MPQNFVDKKFEYVSMKETVFTGAPHPYYLSDRCNIKLLDSILIALWVIVGRLVSNLRGY
jgi:hypothetical protein